MEARKLEKGQVVQLSPDCPNRMFAGCMMVVDEPKSFGAQGYVQALGHDDGPGGQAYIRIAFEHMELVGQAVWVID